MAEKILGLKGLIYGKFETETAFSKHLGWTRQKLNNLTTGKKSPNIDEVYAIAQGLDADFETIAMAFLRYWSPDRQRGGVDGELDTAIPPEKCFDDEE